jgi:hypothetical protein
MRILYDLFPAHFVIAAPGVYETPNLLTSSPPSADAYYLQTTRVIVTDTHITVAQDVPGGPQIVFHEPYAQFEKSLAPEVDSYVTTNTNKTIAFKKDTNCGCGSTLRGWNPYRTLNSMKDPTE